MSDWEHVDKEEIIISEDGLDEAIHNAYLKGKQDVLDKIRAEIEANRNEWIKGTDPEWHTYDRCLSIIDKYRAESEETDAE